MNFPTFTILFAVLLISACSEDIWRRENGRVDLTSYGLKKQSEYVALKCDQKSMVGERETVQLLFRAKQEQLNSLEADISLERHTELSQQLIGYDVLWQTAQNERDRSCRTFAGCLFVHQEHERSCEESRKDNARSREQMLQFIKDLMRFRVTATG